jgi:hypothetical protein
MDTADVITQDIVLVHREGGQGPAADDESALVAAAIGAGFRFPDDQPCQDTIERLEDGSILRKTSWAFVSESIVIDGEHVSFVEFRARIESEDWLRAHPGSTIAKLQRATGVLHLWHQDEFRRPPSAMVRNGLLWAIIPHGAPDAEAQELLRQIH